MRDLIELTDAGSFQYAGPIGHSLLDLLHRWEQLGVPVFAASGAERGPVECVGEYLKRQHRNAMLTQILRLLDTPIEARAPAGLQVLRVRAEEQHMRSAGFIAAMPADGSCMFHALAQVLNLESSFLLGGGATKSRLAPRSAVSRHSRWTGIAQGLGNNRNSNNNIIK